MTRFARETRTTPERTAPERRHDAVPEVPPALLDPRLRTPQMAVLRASIARSLQAGIGNHAVGALLQREPAAAPPRPAVEHTSGKVVDDALTASPYFAKLIEAKFKGGTKADGHVYVESESVFEEAYTRSALTKTNPATGKLHTEEEARAKAKLAAAFPDKGDIHVNEAFGDPGTVVHEAMHLFSSPYLRVVGYNATEGTTEYFTKLLCTEVGITRGVHYADRLAPVEKLIALLGGDEVLAAAYFQDKLAELEAAVDAKKTAGTFDQWVTAMRAGKYTEADALLQ